LACEKPVRFGWSLLAKGTVGYETAVADGDNSTISGFFHEPRRVISLNVMFGLDEVYLAQTPSERRY